MSAREDAHLDPGRLVEFEQGQLGAQEAAVMQEHLESCGRCSAELALVRSYLSVPEDALLDEGRSGALRASFGEHLNAVDHELARDTDAPRIRTVRRAAAPPAPHRSAGARRWAVGGLIAASLALIVVAAGLFSDGLIYPDGGGQLRSSSDGNWAQALLVEQLDDGSLELSWSLHPQAQEYRVFVLDSRGESVYEDVTAEASLRFSLETIQAIDAMANDGPRFAVVEFKRAGGEIQRTAPRVLPMP